LHVHTFIYGCRGFATGAGIESVVFVMLSFVQHLPDYVNKIGGWKGQKRVGGQACLIKVNQKLGTGFQGLKMQS
jgi:hypothetical protein